MSEAQTMTLDERISIGLKALALEKQGKKEEGERVFKQIPMSPYLAKLIKEDWKAGDWLKESGWNLSEAEAAFGPGWLDRQHEDSPDQLREATACRPCRGMRRDRLKGLIRRSLD